MTNMKRMSLNVPEDLYNFIALESKRVGVPMNAFVIFALNDYRERKEAIKEHQKND